MFPGGQGDGRCRPQDRDDHHLEIRGAAKKTSRAFKEGFGAAGGQVVGELWVPFPEVEFQSFLTQIAEKKPDGVFAFFAGGGAVKFVKDYAAAGLKKSVPLYGPGFLTDGTLPAQGEAAEGLQDHAALRRRSR